ncbi:MAG: PspA/IM30 family protein [Myxococcota bacterium]
MGFFNRLNTVLKSNLNALVDQAEDPEKLIAQTALDMRAEMKKAKRELVQTLGTAKRLEKEAGELEEEAEGWEEKAVLALKSGDDDLAREALKRKQKVRKQAEDARARAAQQARNADAMKDTLERIEQKVEELEDRKAHLASAVRQARKTPGTAPGGSSRFGSETFDELERMAGRIDQLDAEVEVHGLIDDSPEVADLEARFRALDKATGSSEVEDELAALKRKLD